MIKDYILVYDARTQYNSHRCPPPQIRAFYNLCTIILYGVCAVVSKIFWFKVCTSQTAMFSTTLYYLYYFMPLNNTRETVCLRGMMDRKKYS